MRRIVSLAAVALLLGLMARLPATGQTTNKLMAGTQMRVVLLNGLSTGVNRDGDPFEAATADPVFLANQLILPAGTRVRGVVQRVYTTKRFNLIRGQAAMVLQFKSLVVGDHEVPIQMSILSIEKSSQDASRRKDLSTEEGQIVQEKPDIRGDVEAVALGTSGGTLAGMIFSHVVRGLALGVGGGAAYVLIRRGKELQLPAQTAFQVRLDTTIDLPATGGRAAGSASGSQ